MIYLTEEQAQQIEEALVATLKNNDYWLEKCTGALDTIRAARTQEQGPVELIGVKEVIEEGGGFWHSCSGCYESNEGAPPKGATYSTIFQCYLGCGCDECGGLGAVWDNTDYEDMARFMAGQDAAPVEPVKQEHSGEANEKVDQDCDSAQHHRYAGSFCD